MKKTKILSFLAAALSIGFVACNNDADDTASTDSTTTENTATTTTTSTGTYAAQAETYKTNSDVSYRNTGISKHYGFTGRNIFNVKLFSKLVRKSYKHTDHIPGGQAN